MILALDIATNVGWCLGGPDGAAPRFGTLTLPGGATHAQETRSMRALYDWASPLCKIAKVKVVAIEAPWLAPGRSEHNVTMAFYLVGAARLAASTADALDVFERVQSVRKVFIGQGNLPRDEAKAAVMARCRQLGWSPNNYDESDAGALWYWAMANTYPKWQPRRAA